MEGLAKIVGDEEIIAKLLDAKFTDASIPFITEGQMSKLDIPLGIQALIFNYTQKLALAVGETSVSSPGPSTSKKRPAASPSPKQHALKFQVTEIKHALESTPAFRNTYYGKLEEDLPLTSDELGEMSNAISDHYFYTSVMAGDYPSTTEKRDLARALITIYPMLRSKNLDIPESDLFRTVDGKNKGLIEQRICTLRGKVKKENRLFTRKPAPVYVAVPEMLIQKSSVIATYPAVQDFRPFITQGMGDLQELHEFLINTHETPTKIISMLPKLLAFNGDMILESFKRFQDNRNEISPVSAVLARALLMANVKLFSEISDAYIRACLILLREMPVRGVQKREISNTELSSVEIHAAPLIRWIKADDYADYIRQIHDMHIICEGSPNLGGQYCVYVAVGQVVEIGTNSCQAINVLMKSFTVFGQKVPLLISRLHEFLSILCFGNLTESGIKCVVKCVEKFRLSMEKEAL